MKKSRNLAHSQLLMQRFKTKSTKTVGNQRQIDSKCSNLNWKKSSCVSRPRFNEHKIALKISCPRPQTTVPLVPTKKRHLNRTISPN